LLEIAKPKPEQPLPKCLPRGDVQKILTYPMVSGKYRDDFNIFRDTAIIAMLLYSGLRASELCNLKLFDVDIQEETINVYKGKGNKDRHPPIYFKLKPHLVRYLKERNRLKKSSEYFFVSLRDG